MLTAIIIDPKNFIDADPFIRYAFVDALWNMLSVYRADRERATIVE